MRCSVCFITGNDLASRSYRAVVIQPSGRASGAVSPASVNTSNDGVHITDALTILIHTRSVGVTCARHDMCCIDVVHIAGSVHNRMIVMNSSGALEFLVYELARNVYGVRQVRDATESSWSVRRITSVHQDLFYIVFCICYTTGTSGSNRGAEKWVVFADGHPQLNVVDAKAAYGVQSYGRHWFQT